MRILGLDPGSRYTGYGFIERQGSKLRPLAQGRIVLPARAPLPDRLTFLCRELRELTARLRPDTAVIESLYRGVNSRSLIVLAQARGALIATVAEAGLGVQEYSPAEIKTALTGSGRADKTQVSRMVRLVLGLEQEELTADASDALAVAICFAQRLRLDHLAGAGGRSR